MSEAANTQAPSTETAVTTVADDVAKAAAAAAAAKEGEGAALDLTSKTEGEQPKAKEEPKPDEGAAVTYTYDSTGDAGLDVALGFIGGLGFAADNPAVVAATKGDFKPLSAALAALGDKARGYQNMVALAEQSYKAITAKASAATEATEKLVYDTAGGKDQWMEVRDWVAANADDAEKAHIAAAFKAGGFQAQAVAKTLVEAYAAKGGKPKQVVKTDTPKDGGSQASGALDPKSYAREVAKLRRATPGGIDGTAAYAALQQRARAYRG